MEETRKVHLMYGGLLFLAALITLVAYISFRSRADSNTSLSTSASVGNSAPTLGTVYVNTTGSTNSQTDPITPADGTTKTVYVNGTYTDLNGCREVASSTLGGVKAAFYRSGASGGFNCSADNNNCYQVATSTCVISGCDSSSDTDASYSCTLSLQYYADRTDGSPYTAQTWVGNVRVMDQSLDNNSDSSTAPEVATLLALDIPSSLNFGSLSVGALSSINTVSPFINNGNATTLQPELNATAASFVCTTGTIAIGNLMYSSSSVFAATNTMTTGQVEATLNLHAYTVADAANYPGTTSTYWRLQMPAAGGYAGTCTATVTAVATE